MAATFKLGAAERVSLFGAESLCSSYSKLLSLSSVKVFFSCQCFLLTFFLSHTHILYYRDLFNAAFISCWTELQSDNQDQLIYSLEQALSIQDCPEITQAILNLAEFMDHSEKVLFVLKFTVMAFPWLKCCIHNWIFSLGSTTCKSYSTR